MFIKQLGIFIALLLAFSCSIMKEKSIENSDSSQNEISEEMANKDMEAEETSGLQADSERAGEATENQEQNNDTIEESTAEDIEEQDNTVVLDAEEDIQENQDLKAMPATQGNYNNNSEDVAIQIKALNTEIDQLKSELDYYTDMLKDLNAKSSVWGNPFSVYNKEIILSDGTTLYGKIIYQDQAILKVETLIGGMVIPRNSVVRVVQNMVSLDSDDTEPDISENIDNNFEEINDPESGISLIERKKNKKNASLSLVGDITDELDGSGNRVLSGTIKNVGTDRADFCRIEFTIRKNWQGDVFRENAWVNGSSITCQDDNISTNSLLPNATGRFTLIIPASKSDMIGHTHKLKWEQMENCKDAD